MRGKTGKEIPIKNDKNFNIIYGIVDNKTPKGVYINISCWGEPTFKSNVDYNRIIKQLDKKLRQTIFEELNVKIFNRNRTIIDLDIRESGISYGKRSYLNCEVFLIQNLSLPLIDKRLKSEVTIIIESVIKILDESIYFNFYKTKKK
jgi:hypothetical protein